MLVNIFEAHYFFLNSGVEQLVARQFESGPTTTSKIVWKI